MNVTNNGYDPKAWLNAYKSNKGKADTETKSAPSANNKVDTFTKTTTTTTTTDSTASSFASTSDYHDYLKETYSSIGSCNISISDTCLQQAMNDPEKEKILTDFLKEIEGSEEYRAGQIEGLNDDTHNYELTGYSIQLDSIDKHGVVGTEFLEITVARNDGERINKKEFKELEKNVDALFEQLEHQRKEQVDQASKFLKKNLEILNHHNKQNKNEVKEKPKDDFIEKLEEKRAEEKEAQEKLDAKAEKEKLEGSETPMKKFLGQA